MAESLEERMRQAEREREQLEEAQRRAEEARRLAVEAAGLEKAEREIKVIDFVIKPCIIYIYIYNYQCISVRSVVLE